MAALVAVVFLVVVLIQSRGASSLMYDSFRDMAWARAMLEGRFWQDPFLAGEGPWYPPGNPALFAAIAGLFGGAVSAVYTSSTLWWNVWIPVALFAAVRRESDRATGLVVPAMLFLGSLWWMTHLAAPMPSIQGILPALLGLLLWQRATGSAGGPPAAGTRRWAVSCGAALAASCWVHPICALVGAAGVGCDGMLRGCRGRADILRTLGLVAGTAVVLSSPVLVHQLSLQRSHTVATRFAAAELWNPDFALQLHVPLILLTAVVGIVVMLRRRQLLWALGILGVGVAGQLPVYLHRWLGWRLPWLIPHEFQWHSQLAVAVCAAVGVVWLAQRMAAAAAPRSRMLAAPSLWVVALMLAVLSPAVWLLGVSNAYLIDLRPIVAARGELADWLRVDTPGDAVVVCGKNHGYMIAAGLAGRRCVAVPVGFMNPGADVQLRNRDLERLLHTANEAEFLHLARRYRANYVMVVMDSTDSERLAERVAAFSSVDLAFRTASGNGLVFKIR